MMPYEVNDYTNCIYPLKLHEYLATGRPVVATPIDMVEPFADAVRVARTPPGVGSGTVRKPAACSLVRNAAGDTTAAGQKT